MAPPVSEEAAKTVMRLEGAKVEPFTGLVRSINGGRLLIICSVR